MFTHPACTSCQCRADVFDIMNHTQWHRITSNAYSQQHKVSAAAVPMIFPFKYCCILEVGSWPAPDELYVNACRQRSLSVGWSVQHALRTRGTLRPHCSTVRPCGLSCQPPGHVFKSCSGKVGRWGGFSTGSNCTAGSGWALRGGPGLVPAYDSQGAPCTLLHWTLPLIWCTNMAGNILVPPGNWQQQVCRLRSATDHISLRLLSKWNVAGAVTVLLSGADWFHRRQLPVCRLSQNTCILPVKALSSMA